MRKNLADSITETIGSWWFLGAQTVLLIIYVALNLCIPNPPDSFPFIFLNLILSFQAAYTAPVILMSHNRIAERDRELARKDREHTQQILRHIEKLEKALLKGVEEAVEDITEVIKEEDHL
jgi:uncharacterized membrane protein